MRDILCCIYAPEQIVRNARAHDIEVKHRIFVRYKSKPENNIPGLKPQLGQKTSQLITAPLRDIRVNKPESCFTVGVFINAIS